MPTYRSHHTAAVPLVLAIVGSAVVAAAPTATAAAPQPTSTSRAPSSAAREGDGPDPRTLFVEEFERGVDTTPVMLDRYVGEDGETYTADPAWLDPAQCNGIVTSASSSDVASCASNDNLRALGEVLGRVTGADPATNHVVSAWTSSRNLPENAVQIESVQPFSLGRSGRYVSFGVSAAAGACVGYAHPLLDFILVDGATERKVSPRPLDPCSDARSEEYSVGGSTFKGGEYVSSGGILFSGDELRWRLRNAQSSSSGNDGAIDRVTIVDSTPTVEQDFDGTPIIGDTARMTLRVVNTSEHGAKPGWSFRQALPAGLTVAQDAGLQTTCANPTTTIAEDRSSVSVAGDLAIDAADCTVSFDVVAAAPGAYTSDASLVTELVGLDTGAGDTVDFAPEQNTLTLTERAVLAGGDDVADLDEQVSFTTTVQNDGNVAVHDLAATGSNGTVTCASSDLDPGASTECSTAPHTVGQDDLDAGSVSDSMHVTATSRGGSAVESDAEASVATTASAAAAQLELRAVAEDRPGVGDRITLEGRVRNSGNVSIRDLALQVDHGFTADCPAGALAPGAAVDCVIEGSYTVTQADMDSGSVAFAASLTGVGPAAAPVSDSATTTVPTQAHAAALEVVAEATVEASGAAPRVGDPVALTIGVRNTGNVTVDSLVSRVVDRDGMRVDCPAAPLAPSAGADCTVSSYRLTQADVDAGDVEFRVTATAVDAGGDPVDASDSSSASVDAADVVGLTALASVVGQPDELPAAGTHVALAAVVRNDGNTTLRDPRLDLAGSEEDGTCPAGALAPGAEVSCTVPDHELTQDEVDAGSVSFAFSVDADAPGRRTAHGSDEASVELPRVAAITASATSVLDASAHEVPLAGDTARVTARIENTGNVSVTGLRASLTDRWDADLDCAEDALAPGEDTSCTGSGLALTQEDVDAGSVRFDVDAAATGADRQRAEGAASSALVIVQAPAITTEATVSSAGHGAPRAGDAAEVTAVLRNRGNVTLSGIGSVVAHAGDTTYFPAVCADEVLAPGSRTTCRFDAYRLTQADIDAGALEFVVSSTATGPSDRTASDDDRARTTLDRAPSIATSVQAHHATVGDGVPVAGDRIALRVTVRNTGNTTVTEPRGEFVELPDAVLDCPAEPLVPGAEITCATADHVITQSELERGAVSFIATVEADAPDGTAPAARDEARVGLDARTGFDVRAEVLVDRGAGHPERLGTDRVVHPGDRLSVRYTVRNTGNLSVDDLQDVPGTQPLTVDAAHLEPGAATTASTREHVVTEQEAEAGGVVLVGQVRGLAARASGAGDETAEGPTTGQSAGVPSAGVPSDGVGGRSARAEEPSGGVDRIDRGSRNGPVWVFSERIRSVAKAELVPALPELAFTGSEALVAVPVAVLLLGTGLLLVVLRRRPTAQRGRHRS